MEFENNEEMMKYCRGTGRTYVAMALEQAEKPLGTVVLELFTDIAPATCKNFLEFVRGCPKGHYKNSPIHRVVKNGWIQGGDVVDGSGKGDPGFVLPDETFAVKHDAPGILGMANKGESHTANTQFYVTLSPLPFLDGKRVGFGRVLTRTGMEYIESLQNLPLYQNERPVPDVHIMTMSVLHEP